MEKVYVVKTHGWNVQNYGVYTDKEKALEVVQNFVIELVDIEEQLRITPETRKLLEQARLHAMSVVGHVDDALKCEGAEVAIEAAEWWDGEADNLQYKFGKLRELIDQDLAQAGYEENEGVII